MDPAAKGASVTGISAIETILTSVLASFFCVNLNLLLMDVVITSQKPSGNLRVQSLAEVQERPRWLFVVLMPFPLSVLTFLFRSFIPVPLIL